MKTNEKETEETQVNEEYSPNSPTNDVNINDNYGNEMNDYEFSPDTPTNGVNNETIENDEGKK